MKKLLNLLIALFSLISYAQVQNSNKESIADFYDASSKRFSIDGGKVELQFRLKKDNVYYISNVNERIEDSTDYTILRSAEKVRAWFLDVGFVNTSSFTDLDALDFKKIGYKIGLTYQHSFSKIYFKPDYDEIVYPKLWAWKISVSGTLDRFDNFDPTKNEIENILPFRAGVNGNISHYLFTNKKSWYNFHLVPTFSGRVNFIDYNKLENYILNSNLTLNNEVSVTSNSSFDGKFGVLNNDGQSSFFSFSLPMIAKNKWTFFNKSKGLAHLTPVPHISWQTFVDEKPVYNTGIALGFLPESLFGEDKKNDEKKDSEGKTVKVANTHYRTFNSSSFLSFGVDWNFIGGITKKPQYTVTGTFFIK